MSHVLEARQVMTFGELDDEPLDDHWNKWGLGGVVPCVIGLYGLAKIMSCQAILYGFKGRPITLTGWDAIAFGIGLLGAAFLMHAHYHWSLSRRLVEYASLGKVMGLFVAVLFLGFVIVRNAAPF
jgi:hypothetical protein